MASAPLSAGALAELRTLCAAAQRDPSLLHHASLADLRGLLRSLGATLPPEATPGAAAVANDEDLRDDECVAPDTPSQEMGPTPGAAEPSEEVRKALHAGSALGGPARTCPRRLLLLGTASDAVSSAFASMQAQTAAAEARDAAAQAAAAGDFDAAVAAYTTALKARSRNARVHPRTPPLTPRARRPRRLRCCTRSAPSASSS